jgi:hydrogenase maturation protein HypF
MREIKSFEKIYKTDDRITHIACDAHSAYGSAKLAATRSRDSQAVFHHEAHLESLIAEQGFSGRALGVVCDGTGLGDDGSIWGGEFFLVDGNHRQRVGSLLPFRLPGGESAVKEPRRSALGMLYETYGDAASTHPLVTSSFRDDEASLLFPALKRNINTPQTSSLGRLFDGFAALLGLLSIADYEAQAPLALEAIAQDITNIDPFPVVWERDTQGIWRWDWRNLVAFATEARSSLVARGKFSAAFHATIVQAAHELAEKLDVNALLLTGGVFQNASLVRRFQQRSSSKLFVITHNRMPPGDGGLALGQIAAVRQRGKNNVSRHTR